jgi:hypothetical protein
MRHTVSAAWLATIFAPVAGPALAQEGADPVVAPTPAAPDAALTGTMFAALAAGAFDGVRSDPEAVVGRVELGLKGSLLFEDQTEIGFESRLVVERDSPRTDPRGDATGFTSALGAPTPSLRAIHMRYATLGQRADRGPRAQLEDAFIFVRNPFGEVSLGRQPGVGAGFARAVRWGRGEIAASDARLDLSGITAPIVIDRLSGVSPKVTVKSSRVLGVQLGLSYTPDVNTAGVDDPARYTPADALGAKPDSALEAAIGFELNLPGTPYLVGAHASYSKASGPRVGGLFDDVETTSASLAFEGPNFSLGLRTLNGDNGWAGGGGARGYSATAVRAGFSQDGVAYGLEIATSSDNLVNADTRAAVLSATAPLGAEGSGFSITYGLQGIERESSHPAGTDRTERSVGVFVEVSWASW